ncbi:DUF4373 domain-containing protein [Bacteroidales bacterium SW292]|uniref:DUF4373 domain-containing protein n=1 Tax=Mediterranea sp. An20 TaxID=1965586 RepID=UPI000B3A9DA4|nr:DUF4373 domain-containing protein [Mediterranea sp. An20]MBW9201932.1 DUF4373 domain-containing protein [Bacteroidales bacterium SW292]OUP12086.1 hypothetical protein B5F34_00285 [Mediterranea sp. An20]
MPKLKRQGIDFFTIHTDYLHSRAVRRVMKREGEAAIAVLMETYAAIYAGDGYYVEAGPRLFDDLADLFFRLEPEDVKRILETAIENGLFDAGLYSQYGILTSSGIQSEFIYATRKRINKSIDPRFNLLTDDDEALCCRDMPEPKTPDGQRSGLPRRKEDGENEGTEPTETCPEKVPGNTQKVPGTTQKAEDNAKKRDLTPQSTHTTRHNTTRHEENPLLKGSPGDGETEGAGWRPAEVDAGAGERTNGKPAAKQKAREWTQQDIDALQPPDDGLPRNLEGLKINFLQHRIPPKEQYAIILKSNYGVIGHPVWRGFGVLRESHGKIRQPSRYLLSLCVK